jgi:hypothetical protein
MRTIGKAGRLWRAMASVLLVALFGSAAPAPAGAAAAPPLPAGTARIWIYRDDEPYVTLATPYVRLNGRIVGVSEPGGAFYRDVPPGIYKVTVDSPGRDVNQFVTVALASGQTVYVKVEASRWWWSGRGWRWNTYYTQVIPPSCARNQIAGLPVACGG